MSEQTKDGNVAAFPCEQHELSDNSWNQTFDPGMTLRQYAAIKLRVPESGDEWLDDMIRKSLRDDFASKAMQGLITSGQWRTVEDVPQGRGRDEVPGIAYGYADAMLRAREVQS